ncbi:hypothetical protein B5X24_HaOG207152 [Helicoverpa armigera]|uniref:Kazal-like domain-containing protein n=1 Tax=Helicoverpa armigera TaxID=29058 RepID=A0A2W1BIC0_HELAM|nr:hypothetical protein B5X24_HaOG207152 [Helicoverpa armigera]
MPLRSSLEIPRTFICLKFLTIVAGWTVFIFISINEFVPAKANYEKLKKMFSLVDPYILPPGQEITQLENFTDCACPRVFWPACGENNETYYNACVLKCIKETALRRLGPCFTYRRTNTLILDMRIPNRWKLDTSNVTLNSEEELENVLLSVPSTYKEDDDNVIDIDDSSDL